MSSNHIVMLVLHDIWRPGFDGRIYREAITLLNAGYRVTLISFVDIETMRKYDLSERSSKEGIEVHRIPYRNLGFRRHPFGASQSRSKRIIDFMKIIKKENPDFIHCHDFETLWMGVRAKMITRKPLIYDAHELITHMYYPMVYRLRFGAMEKMALPFVDMLITANHSRIEVMKKIHPLLLKGKRIVPIYNYPHRLDIDIEKEAKRLRRKLDVEKKVVFLYQGGLEKDRGLREIIQATRLVKNRDAMKFFIFGGSREGSDQIKREFRMYFDDGIIQMEPNIPYAEIRSYIAMADVGIFCLLNSCLNNYYCAPNKLYEYMHGKSAILGVDFPEMAEVIRTHSVGRTCDFSNLNEIASNMDWFLENKKEMKEMKTRAGKAALQHYTWEKNNESLHAIYRDLA